MKLQSFFEDKSVLKVFLLNTIMPLNFTSVLGPNVLQKMFLDIKRELVKQSVVHDC